MPEFTEPEPTDVYRPPPHVRVVVLTHEVTRGGPAKSSVDLACSLSQLGYRVTCLAHPRFGVPLHTSEQLSEAKVQLHLLRPGRVVSPLTICQVLVALRDLCPDVLIVHRGELVAMAAPLKGLYGNPRLVFAKRGFWSPQGVWRALLRRAAAHVDAVAAVSLAVGRFWALDQPDWEPSTIFLVPNSVRIPSPDRIPPPSILREELHLPPDARLVGAVGRMAWAKGHQYLISALPPILGSFPQTHLVLAGDGSYLADLRALTEHLGLRDRVHFLGWREDIYTVLGALDVFVHPTLLELMPRRSFVGRWGTVPMTPGLAGEPFGRAVLEASAAGVPVVASDAGGHREVIIHGKTGMLVPVADPDAIAEAVIDLLAAPEKAEAMAEAARERVCREYSIQALGQRYHHLIQRLLRGQCSGTGDG